MKKQIVAAILTGSLFLPACGAWTGARAPQVTVPPPGEPAAPTMQPVATPPAQPPLQPLAPAPVPAPAPPAPPARQHVDVRGLYMTGVTAGIDDWFYEIVDFMQKMGLNAMVIDAKDDDGRISWTTEIPLAKEIGANSQKIRDPRQRTEYLEKHGIYPIARLVVYADPILGARRPDLSIHRPDGAPFVDSRNIRWPDPYNRQVWEYNVAVAKSAVAMGFKEIQFDYIRFPEHRIEGFNYKVPVSQRAEAIEGFLRYARQELEPLGVHISADVFGLTTSVAPGDDMEIGQIYEHIIDIVDYIKPMVYPSHYAPRTYGVADPNAQPGKIVYESLVRAQKRTWGVPLRKHRPWIQDFKYGKAYTAADIEAQIRGLAEAGIHQWILWDPSNRYTRNANYDVGKALAGVEPEWRKEFQAEWDRHQEQVLQRAREQGLVSE